MKSLNLTTNRRTGCCRGRGDDVFYRGDDGLKSLLSKTSPVASELPRSPTRIHNLLVPVAIPGIADGETVRCGCSPKTNRSSTQSLVEVLGLSSVSNDGVVVFCASHSNLSRFYHRVRLSVIE